MTTDLYLGFEQYFDLFRISINLNRMEMEMEMTTKPQSCLATWNLTVEVNDYRIFKIFQRTL